MDLDGRSAVVTGASQGIGRATAKTLADAGSKVGLAARSIAKLEAVAEEIEAGGGEALVVPTDMTDYGQVESMITSARDAFNGLDIVVNNAGVGHWEREGVLDGDLDEWTQEIEVNLLGLMYGTHFATEVMEDEGAGDIVNIGSGSGGDDSAAMGELCGEQMGVSEASLNRRCETSGKWGFGCLTSSPGLSRRQYNPKKTSNRCKCYSQGMSLTPSSTPFHDPITSV